MFPWPRSREHSVALGHLHEPSLRNSIPLRQKITTIRAGKYIADGVFVGVEQGTLANSQGATVEIEVFPHVSVTSKVRQTGDSNVGVKLE